MTNIIYCCQCESHLEANLISGSIAYPNRFDLSNMPFWQCPNCSNFVGCHYKTSNPYKPLGTIPSYEIKQIRQRLHSIIDPVWKNNIIHRHKLYKMISKNIGYEFHVGEISDVHTARKAYKEIMKIIKWAYNTRTKKNKPRAKILKDIIDTEKLLIQARKQQ